MYYIRGPYLGCARITMHTVLILKRNISLTEGAKSKDRNREMSCMYSFEIHRTDKSKQGTCSKNWRPSEFNSMWNYEPNLRAIQEPPDSILKAFYCPVHITAFSDGPWSSEGSHLYPSSVGRMILLGGMLVKILTGDCLRPVFPCL